MKKAKWLFGLIAGLLLLPGPAAAEESSGLSREIMYGIMVDRYNNGNHQNDSQVDVKDPHAYHGGDFKGISKKLESIEKLGFTTIVLSPIVKNAPKGYHGYWAEDLYELNPQFGSQKELDELLNRAHDKQIKVVLEFPAQYISSASALFKSKKDWFKEEKPEPGPEWKKGVRELNLNNPDASTYVTNAALHWLDQGFDGLVLKEADKLPDSFIRHFAASMKRKKPAAYLVAESGTDANGYARLSSIREIDAVQNEAFKEETDRIFSQMDQPASALAGIQSDILYADDKESIRFAQKAGENGRNAVTAWKLVLTYLYTAKGTPFIYQGSEMPMYGANVQESEKLVEFNSGDPDLKEYMERIAALRKQFSVLSDGAFKEVAASGGLTVFKRYQDKETIYIAINNDSQSRGVKLSEVPEGKQLKGYLGDNLVRADQNGDYTITLPRETAEVYMIENDSGINWLFIAFIAGVMAVFIIAVIMLGRRQKKSAQA